VECEVERFQGHPNRVQHPSSLRNESPRPPLSAPSLPAATSLLYHSGLLRFLALRCRASRASCVVKHPGADGGRHAQLHDGAPGPRHRASAALLDAAFGSSTELAPRSIGLQSKSKRRVAQPGQTIYHSAPKFRVTVNGARHQSRKALGQLGQDVGQLPIASPQPTAMLRRRGGGGEVTFCPPSAEKSLFLRLHPVMFHSTWIAAMRAYLKLFSRRETAVRLAFT